MSQQIPFLQQVRNSANVTLDQLLATSGSNDAIIYAAANSALIVAEAAYSEANTCASNIANNLTLLETVYAAGNTNATNINTTLSVAQAAYAQANQAYANSNTAFNNSGVSAGSYGGTAAIPVITVDGRGRVTAASTTTYRTFSSTLSGIVPASAGGTTNFLRADGTWAAPSQVLVAGATSSYSRTYSSGVALDPNLQITLLANHTYAVDCCLYLNTNAGWYAYMYCSGGPDSGYAAYGVYGGSGLSVALGGAVNSQLTFNVSATIMLCFKGVIDMQGSNGTLSVAWGNPNNPFSATRYAGSYITAIQVV